MILFICLHWCITKKRKSSCSCFEGVTSEKGKLVQCMSMKSISWYVWKSGAQCSGTGCVVLNILDRDKLINSNLLAKILRVFCGHMFLRSIVTQRKGFPQQKKEPLLLMCTAIGIRPLDKEIGLEVDVLQNYWRRSDLS